MGNTAREEESLSSSTSPSASPQGVDADYPEMAKNFRKNCKLKDGDGFTNEHVLYILGVPWFFTNLTDLPRDMSPIHQG